MPQETKANAVPTHADPKSLHGWTVDDADPVALCRALEKAFDYRGDVTLTLKPSRTGDPAEDVTGYIFDRVSTDDPATSNVRLLVPGSDVPTKVAYDRIATLAFSGKDAAHGKSFESWIKRFTESRLAGKEAGIH